MKNTPFIYLRPMIFLTVFSLFQCVGVYAEILLPEIFSDNMVLQQQTDAPLWGKASPGKNVTLVTSWDNREYSARSDNSGNWKISVKTPVAGGPYSISISDGKKKNLRMY